MACFPIFEAIGQAPGRMCPERHGTHQPSDAIFFFAVVPLPFWERTRRALAE
jgi:hypothetical protein